MCCTRWRVCGVCWHTVASCGWSLLAVHLCYLAASLSPLCLSLAVSLARCLSRSLSLLAHLVYHSLHALGEQTTYVIFVVGGVELLIQAILVHSCVWGGPREGGLSLWVVSKGGSCTFLTSKSSEKSPR